MRLSVFSARKLAWFANLAPALFLAAWSLGICPTESAAASTPTFVQVRSSQITTGTTNRLGFLSANTAGNLIVVYAIWNNTGTASVSDSRGNVYQSAIGPTLWGNNYRAQVFYAKNIAAGANTVTVRFSTTITSFGIAYIHEYSRIDKTAPLDVVAAATGTSSAMSSGLVAVTNPTDLLFGAAVSSNTATSAGTNYRARSMAYGNLTEDRVITTIGSYSATGTQNGNAWAMQMVAFKAASTQPDTTAPTVSITVPTASPTYSSSSAALSLRGTASDNVGVTQVTWANDRGGSGTATGTTSWSVAGIALQSGSNALTVTARDLAGNTGTATLTVTYTPSDTQPPSVPTNLSATTVSANQINLSWTASTDNVGVAGYKVFRGGSQIATVTSGTSYQDKGLTPSTSYSYTIAAYDAAGNTSAQAASAQATTAGSLPIISSFAASPAQITSGQSTTLSWSVSNATSLRINNGIGTVTGTSRVVTPTKTTTYTLTAANSAGSATASKTVTVRQDTQAPTVPTNLTAVAVSPSQINLTWAASTDNVGVAGYIVYRNSSQVVQVISGTSYQDTGLSPGTTYTYNAAAYDAAGNVSALSSSASATCFTGPAYPLKVSSNGRYLVDQNDVPFLIVGDSPHSLIVNLTEAQAEQYFADRSANGFNAVWIEMLCNTNTGGRSDGSTYDGIVPFTTPGDLSTPNPAYFARADDMINLAAKYGITVFLDPIDTAGWQAVYESNGLTKGYNYGAYLGNRYRSFPNIVWLSGNDFQTWTNSTDDADVLAVAQGIKDADPIHIQTIELNYNSSSSLDDSKWAPIVSLNAACTYYPTYAEVLHAYNQSGSIPTFMVEANYEFENNAGLDYGNAATLRRQEYWTMLSGATGQFYGNHYTWTFPTGWQSYLDTPSVTQLGYMKTLFSSRPWYNLVPDQNHTIVTAGYGTFSSTGSLGSNDYLTAASTPNGMLVMAYLPTVRAVTVDMSKLASPAVAQWYDPTNNTYTTISDSPFANSGSLQFAPPDNNSAGDGDWVLLLQASSAPGTYTTNFPLTENPISESDNWVGGQTAGNNLWGDCRTNGTMVYGVSQPTSFGDPTAILTGTWGPDQTVQTTVEINGTPSDPSEVELRLRSTIDSVAHTITGYEVYCSVVPSDQYCNIARWNGPNGSYCNIQTSSPHIHLVNGDVFKATVTGTNPVTITGYRALAASPTTFTQIVQAIDTGQSTGDCPGGAHAPFTSGNPGVGFYDSNFSTFGFSSFTATDRALPPP